MKKFPFHQQRDAMDCGPACLMMVAASHGRKYALPYLREHSFLSREGVSAQGIMEAAERIGFRTMTVKVPFEQGQAQASLRTAPLPCIAHWNQSHFVVVHRAERDNVWVADPAAGKFKINRADFEKSWSSDNHQGVLILLEPTPDFYKSEIPREKSSLTGFSTLLGYAKPFQRLYIQVLLGMLVLSALQLILPFLTQSVVDVGIDTRNTGFITIILAGQLMLFLSLMTVQFVQNRILLFTGARINVAMVSDFLAKLTRLPLSYFDTKMTGDLLQRIGDQSRIEQFLTQSALPVIFAAFNFVVFSVVLFGYNPLIFMVFGVAAVLYVGWITFFLRRRRQIDYVRFQQSGENSSTVIELIQGMQEIKLQGSERKRRHLWAAVQARLFRTNLQSLALTQWQEAGAGFINQTKNIVITFVAARAVIEGQMTLGMMLATQYMVGQLDAPLQQFITFLRSAQDAKISLERLQEINDAPDEAAQAAGLSNNDAAQQQANQSTFFSDFHPGLLQADLRLDKVSFKYNALNDNVLSELNLVIPQGKVTAIVGTSGSGKTTLVKLLLGVYRPTAGQILLGITPLQRLHPDEWRRHCGAVMQDGYLFSDTIANNISESDDRPDRDRLFQAAHLANIDGYIQDLPLGYNTKIGAQGNGLSQGQRQRLQIARAAYQNPDFLFFDEATNALDANNERIIVQNLQQFYKNRTVIIVAHRLSTVRHADQIVVLERGKIAELGTHEELVRLRGAYFNLVRNQLELGE
jgi:ATP-binding cassette, subfamily B, bacterial